MPSLNKQPFPSLRSSRAAWLRGEIRSQHIVLLAMIPAVSEGDGARLEVSWEAVSIKSAELRCMCAELAGLET